ncbi:MAG: ISL3 family transposase [Thermoanaerobacteraceae bacterium]|jgi:transposase|nr:ISL3 family transposase [Thermoanaerobacteraceae bacterium]
MHSNCTRKLLNLEDVNIKKIVHADNYVKIFIETDPSLQTCPRCGNQTKRIHDYRYQEIKDLPFQLKDTYLVLKKRRYICQCGKRFIEKYHFLASYQRRTIRLSYKIIDLLRNLTSIKAVAEATNVSVNTVSRLLDTINYCTPSIPECIAIDEFKGNTDAGKYQCILIDAKKHRILDILPDRTQSHLSSYIREINRAERHRVKFFVCDMWQPYVDLAKAYFPNATIIIDKYHFIRQVTWAIEKVRKNLQKTMPAKLRKYYKRSRKLILTRYAKLKDENKKACDLMLLYNDDLRLAHYLKEWFYDICQSEKYSYQRTAFWDWVKAAEKSGIPEFEKCAKTYRNWSKGILNAFKYKYTNGPTEGFNNKIKVLKRLSFGIRSFKRFRTRIIHCSI